MNQRFGYLLFIVERFIVSSFSYQLLRHVVYRVQVAVILRILP